jgi:rhodanese-related sulfurtransferase
MIYIIDVREHIELNEKRLLSRNPDIRIINIPESIIDKKVDYVNNLSKNGKVYIGCKKGIRSNKIKLELFNDNPNIQVIDVIDNAPILFKDIELITNNSINIYNIVIHLIIIILIIIIIVLLFNKKGLSYKLINKR